MKATLSLLLFPILSISQNLPQKYILALSKADHQMVVLDYETLDVKAKIPVGQDPHEVITTPDGKTAFVANTANGAAHEINIIDISTLKPIKNVDTAPFFGPHGLAFVNGKLWFTAQVAKSVVQYDPIADKIDWAMGTGQDMTHLLHVTPDGEHFYTTNVESGTVSVFDHKLLEPTIPPTGVLPPNAKPHWDWLQTIIPVGKGNEGFDVSLNGRELWTVMPDGRIGIVNLETRKVETYLKTDVLGLHRLKFTPDDKMVCAVSVRTGDLLFFDAKTRKLLKKIQVGQGAAMLMDKDKNRLFVSCTPNHFVSVVDLKTMEVVRKLEIGGRPDGLTIAEIK